ncbi:MAG: hypothetical protein KGK07_17165 [Chloroflexota bacterium]|nr:hypothetical protein [Chloroflexota bacterium]
MPLRTPNNPTTDVVILTALAPVALGLWSAGGVAGSANTQLAVASAAQGGVTTGADRVYIQTEYQMIVANLFPCVLLSGAQQATVRQSWRAYDGQFVANVDYFDEWPASATTYDAKRAAIAADLERIKANIESNDSLTQNGQYYTISALRFTLSPYEGMLKSYDAITLVYRRLAVVFNVLPYDA